MDRFATVAAELAPAPPPCAVGYCHGSEGRMMSTIKALRAARPEMAVRADGLTSLRILEGLRTGSLAAGIVRGPVPDPAGWRRHRWRTSPWTTSRCHPDIASPPQMSWTPARWTTNRCSSSTGTTGRRRTTPSSRSAPPPAHVRAGSPMPPCRSSGCSTRWRSEPGSGGSTRGRQRRRLGDPMSPCGRCGRPPCTTTSSPCGGPATRRTRRPPWSMQPSPPSETASQLLVA